MASIVAFDKIENDFKFIIVEVTKQLKDTLKYLAHPEEELIEKIVARDDYIDNLKHRIEDHCFSAVYGGTKSRKTTAKQVFDRARAMTIIGGNLERIADYAANIIDQTNYLSDLSLLASYNAPDAFRNVIDALAVVEKALGERNITLAMQICEAEQGLDDIYEAIFKQSISEIHEGKNVENRITLLNIFHYLERMGDALLNIGEAVIFAVLGQRLKVHQFKALEQSLASSDLCASIGDVAFESIWHTKSGCRIGHIRDKRADDSTPRVIFKKGSPKKLEQEKDNIEQWEKIMPGLAPRVVNFQKNGKHSSMLLEYLGDSTFQHIVLNGPEPVFLEAFLAIQKTLQRLWSTTKQDGAVNASYTRQLSARINDVFTVHPAFREPEKQIGSVSVASFDERIKNIRSIDKALSAPFSVYIHGDCNSDNIIYNHESKRVHFIDLNRSRQSDYAQDISVFMVSHFRLPVFDPHIRRRLNTIIKSFYRFAHDYAARHDDRNFDARLTLAIARSLITSTRFELDASFAQTMFLRSIYLIERLINHRTLSWDSFILPVDALMY